MIEYMFFVSPYGKTRYQRFLDHCLRCGAQLPLHSYDAQQYFTLLGLPLMPLKRVRIVRHCRICTARETIPLSQWQAQLAETRALAGSAFASLESASRFLAQIVATQDLETFNAHEDALVRTLSRSPTSLARLGQAYKYFGVRDKAERCLKAAHDGGEVEVAPGELARLWLENGEQAPAEALLEAELGAGRAEVLPACLFLVEIWQSQGSHAKSLAMIDRCCQQFPAATRGSRWKTRRSVSAARKEGVCYGDAPGVPDIQALPGRAPGIAPSTYLVPLLCIAVCLLSAGGYAVLLKYFRPVYFVNGRTSTYEVQLGQNPFALEPGTPTKRYLSESSYDVATNPVLPVDKLQLELRSDFWSRPFGRDVIVVNPDACALFIFVEVTYSSRGDVPAFERLFGASTLYVFPRLEHPFEDLPESLSIRGNSKPTTRRQLLLYSGPLSEIFIYARRIGGLAVLRRVVDQRLRLDPQDQDALTTQSLLDEDPPAGR